MSKAKKLVLTCVVVAICLCSLCIVVFAKSYVPNPGINGSISLTVKDPYYGTMLNSGSFKLYRVASLVEGKDDFVFALTESFLYGNFDLSDIDSPDLAKAVDRYINDNRLKEIAKCDLKNGVVKFDNLEPGVYMIMQGKNVDGYYPILSFLSSIPEKENDYYIYDVDATPKMEIRRLPPVETTITTVTTMPTIPTEMTIPTTNITYKEPEESFEVISSIDILVEAIKEGNLTVPIIFGSVMLVIILAVIIFMPGKKKVE